MYSTLISVALFAVPAFAGFAISSRPITQCEVTKISWEPSNPPYNLIVVAANDPCSEPLADLGDTNKTIVEWKATIPAGTIVQLSVADADGEEAWSGNITVSTSTDSSCLPGKASASSTASASSSSSTASLTGTRTGSSGSSTTGSSDTSDDITPVGAANAGSNKIFNAALSAQQISVPFLAISALTAAVALAL